MNKLLDFSVFLLFIVSATFTFAQDTTITMLDFNTLKNAPQMAQKMQKSLDECRTAKKTKEKSIAIANRNLRQKQELWEKVNSGNMSQVPELNSLLSVISKLSKNRTENKGKISDLEKYKKGKKKVKTLTKELESTREINENNKNRIANLEANYLVLTKEKLEKEKQVIKNKRETAINDENLKIARAEEKKLITIRDDLQQRHKEMEQALSKCNEIVNNNKAYTNKLKNQREQLIQAIYNDLNTEIPKFVFTTNYDLDKCNAYLAQCQDFRVNFLKEEKDKAASLKQLEIDLALFKENIIAVTKADEVINNIYNVSDVSNALKQMTKAKQSGKNMTELNKYQELVKNYCEKNNQALKIMQTAHSFASVGDVDDARTYLKNNLPKYKGYPFLEQQINDKINNLNKSIKLSKAQCSN